MKTLWLLTVVLAVHLSQAALSDDRNEILNELLRRARSQESYYLKIHGVALIDPKDSGYMVRMEITENTELFRMRLDSTVPLRRTSSVTLKPVQYPEGVNSVSNVVVYDGKEWWYDVQYQGPLTSGVRFKDPKQTFKLFGFPDTVIMEVLNDTEARYIGRKLIGATTCEVFQSRAKHFSPYTTGKQVAVEVAIDEHSGLPVRISFNAGSSSSTLNFERAKPEEPIGQARFRPPAGVAYREAQPDGRGGWTVRLAE